MTFKEFLDKVYSTFLEPQAAQWRYGQTIMNVLYDVWPEKYKEIIKSEYDCFYTNRNIDMVLNKLEKEWDNNGS